MGSKTVASTALLVSLNILLFSLVSSTTYEPCPPTPKSPKPKPPSKTPPSPPSPKPAKSCPKDTLKIGVCSNLLNLVNGVVGKPASTPCCSLLTDLADDEAAICLCTAIKEKVLGNMLNIPVSLSMLLNYCGKKAPSGYQCA